MIQISNSQGIHVSWDELDLSHVVIYIQPPGFRTVDTDVEHHIPIPGRQLVIPLGIKTIFDPNNLDLGVQP